MRSYRGSCITALLAAASTVRGNLAVTLVWGLKAVQSSGCVRMGDSAVASACRMYLVLNSLALKGRGFCYVHVMAEKKGGRIELDGR
mmetsp:Transcript_38580/g.89668  ORF Transcript_38580/g.89668 Transcript_38580/m.89668 type:complete len:87 (+) Transcript_38580:971-1231(+)